MNIIIQSLKTAEIVALYNSVGGYKPVKKFADRATAEARLQKVMDEEHLMLASAEDGPYLTDAVDETEDAQPEPQPVVKTGKRGPAPEYADHQTIKVLVNNPKKEGTASYERFDRYHFCTTVGAAVASGVTRADLRWDVAHGYISIK